MTVNCVFCHVAASQDGKCCGQASGRTLASPVISQSDNFWAVLDIAPVVRGHCLIVPKFHVAALADIDHSAWRELNLLLGQVSEAVSNAFGPGLTLFEHGTSRPTPKSSCCIDHAHLHVVPTTVDVTTAIERDGHPKIMQGDQPGCFWALKGIDYLYYRPAEGVGRFYSAVQMPSQYLRRVLGTAVGCPNWHWRDYVDLSEPSAIVEHLLETADQLRMVTSTKDGAYASRGV